MPEDEEIEEYFFLGPKTKQLGRCHMTGRWGGL